MTNYSFKMNIYDYYKYCHKVNELRGVGVITNKQYVFNTDENINGNHYNIALNIEKQIYSLNNKKIDELSNKNIHFYCYINTFLIELPLNNKLSKSQVMLLENILNQLSQYNNQAKDKKVEIQLFSNNKFKERKTKSISEIKKVLHENISNKIIIEEEKIIGKTLSENIVRKNIISQVSLEKCTNIQDIINIIQECIKYSNDTYYNSYIKEIFKDLNEVKELLPELINLNINKLPIEEINYDNIKEKLEKIINEAKINCINEKIDNKEMILEGLEKLLKQATIEQNIIENKDEIKKIYTNYQNIQSQNSQIESEIDEVNRNIDLKKYNKELAVKKLNNNSKNILLEIINIRRNNKIEKIIEEDNQEIEKLIANKKEIINKQQSIIEKIKEIEKQFNILTGLEQIPNDFSILNKKNIFISKTSILKNITRIKNRIISLNEEKKSLEIRKNNI